MNDLISRSALIERMREFANDDWNQSLGGVFTDAVDTCIDFVECAETIEAVPVVKAEWEHIPYSFTGGYRCNRCGQKSLENDWKFCGNCGADMRKGGVKWQP